MALLKTKWLSPESLPDRPGAHCTLRMRPPLGHLDRRLAVHRELGAAFTPHAARMTSQPARPRFLDLARST